MAIQRTEIDFDPENKLKKYLLEKQGVQVNKPQTVKSSLRFLQIPFWVVKSDVWILLQPHSLRLFIFLLLKANRSGHGYVYNEQPVKYLNISENHLFDYFKQLQNLGLIDITANNKRLKYKKYTINKEVPERLRK